jgi:chromate reductase, NAD(P)H dehydrogenase (quinone)
LSSSGAELRTPYHFFKSGESPVAMNEMAQTIAEADCYLVVSPEYNHSIPPALSSMMGHFPGSSYGFKPSGIITYSSGPFGGARCAMALRPFLSELGCLPVSKLAIFPSPSDYLDPEGVVSDPAHRMLNQLPDVLTQVEWWALAASEQRVAEAEEKKKNSK